MTNHRRIFDAHFIFATLALAVACLLAGCSVMRQTQPPAGEKERVLAQQQYLAGDHVLALSSLLESARLGNFRAEGLLVATIANKCWRIGVHQAEDFVYVYQAAAQRNEPFGLTVLGLMREFGFSPASMDLKLAREYYARAAAQGNDTAKSRLAWLDQNPSVPPTASALSGTPPCMR